MIDTRIIQALTSSDPDKRKKAVAYLAKSLDRDALPHLARVSASDKDPQIRELAKKATAYIEKNAPEPEPAYDDDDDELFADEPTYAYADEDEEDEDVYTPSSRYSSLYDDDDDETDTADEDEIDVPLPADIQVSAVAEERAKSYVNQAIDWSERGNPSKAVDMLKQAFKLNPHLFYESYSMGVAQNITGMNKRDTQRLLMPSARDLKRMGVNKDEKSAKEPTKLNIFQLFFALVVFLGATASLVSFFVMPWVDFSDLPVPPDPSFPQAMTLGAQVDATKALFDAQLAPMESMINQVGGEIGAFLRRLIDGLRSVRVTTTGMDVMLLVIGAQNGLDAFGFGGIYAVLFDALDNPTMRDTVIESTREFTANLGLDPNSTTPEQLRVALRAALDLTKYTATPPDYSVIAVPVVASIAFLLSLLLFMNPSNAIWVLNILIGLVGVGACAYFYTTGFDLMLRGDANSATSVSIMAGGTVSLPEDMSFIGLGFWVSMGGMIAVAIAPFLGLLFAPAKKTE